MPAIWLGGSPAPYRWVRGTLSCTKINRLGVEKQMFQAGNIIHYEVYGYIHVIIMSDYIFQCTCIRRVL